MVRLLVLTTLLAFAFPVYADQLDGLRILGVILPCLAISGISLLVVLASTFTRFVVNSGKVNIALNISASILIVTMLIMIGAVGLNTIDSGFLLFCLIMCALAGTLIYFNTTYKLTSFSELTLDPTTSDDLPVLFEFQKDPKGVFMAAFTSENPDDKEAYLSKWNKLIANPNIVMFTYRLKGKIIGSVVHFDMMGETNVSYWLDRDMWNKGLATQGLKMFLSKTSKRPLYARTAFDNFGSQRVLEKAGFLRIKTEKVYANARQQEIEEYVYLLH